MTSEKIEQSLATFERSIVSPEASFDRWIHGDEAAITAAAHKIARILFHLITTRQRYDESVFAVLEQRSQQRQISILKKRAAVLGFELKPAVCVP